MSETERQHAQHRAAGATKEAPAGGQQPAEGPAATYEKAEPELMIDGEVTAVTDAEGASPLPEGEGSGDIEAERAKANEYLEQWRRSAADFANFKRRTEQDRAEMAKLFNESLVKSLLPVLDNFERALAAVPPELASHSWVEGVSLTEKQLRSALEKEGLAQIDAMSQKFDPNLHEAVAHDVSDEHEEDSVIEEFQKGYKLHDRVIRPSMVKVSRRS
ncbi:MAG TPA: nucleotide exchange factor GrpE [Chloroflexota bacterium]|nr:nucleotide exchange factor GrpE [Chloroflexota bacterium]